MTDCKPKDSLTARLNKRVTIQRPPTDEEVAAAEKDEYNRPVDLDWPTVCTIWAAVEPLQGNEYHAARSEQAEVTTRIRIRYRSGIDRTMKVVYKSTEFEIMDIINPKMANLELQLMSKERQ